MRPYAPLLLLLFSGCAAPEAADPAGLSTSTTSTAPASTAATTTAATQEARTGVLRDLECDLMGSREATEDNVVARRNESYQEAWRRLCASPGQDPPAEAPAVAFPQENAVLYAWGTKPSSGFAVEIQKVEVTGGELVVHVRRTSPGLDCATMAVITYPAAAVAIQGVPEMSQRWEFEDVTHSCV